MRYSSRFFLYAPFLLLLVLTFAVGAWWWHAAGTLERKLQAMKGQPAVPGVILDWSHVAISGFPFRLDIAFDDFSARAAGIRAAWQTQHLVVHALTYGAEKDVFEAAGNQRLVWTLPGEAPWTLDFLPGALRASAVRDNRGLMRFDLDIIELAGKDFSIGRAQFHMRQVPGKTIDLMLAADLAKGDLGPFGSQIKRLEVYQSLSHGAAFAAMLAGDERVGGDAAQAWRNAGGTVTLVKSALNGKANALTPAQRDLAIRLLAPLY